MMRLSSDVAVGVLPRASSRTSIRNFLLFLQPCSFPSVLNFLQLQKKCSTLSVGEKQPMKRHPYPLAKASTRSPDRILLLRTLHSQSLPRTGMSELQRLCHLRFQTSSPSVRPQAVRRVLTLASSDEQSASGPVRYVRKPQSDKVTDGRPSFDRQDGKKWGSVQYDPPDTESKEASTLDTKRRNHKMSQQLQRRGPNIPKDPDSPYFFEAYANRRRSRRKGTEDEGSLHIQPELDAEQPQLTPGVVHGLERFSVGNLFTPESHLEQLPGVTSRRRTSNDDPSTLAKSYAITILGKGLQTESNLRSKLERKNFPAQVIDETINDLQRCGLQSDKEYAEVFARSRWKDNTWGPSRIKFALSKKGLDKAIVEAAIVNLFQKNEENLDNQEESEEVMQWGMTTEAAEHLISQARRRWAQGDMELEVRRRRMIGWLQRRGFCWSDISDILEALPSK